MLLMQLMKAASCRLEYLITMRYISISLDIKAAPYIIVRYSDCAS